MQKKVDAHIFAGMQKDMAISKHKNEFLYDAYNIRFTPMEGNTMMSITNERGPKYQLACEGKYVGHCVVDKYLVLFTKKIDGTDRIVKFEPNISNTETILYEGNLNFQLDHPLETLGVYENENIIKVYWVDGVNQPRVINIKDVNNPVGGTDVDTQFDFVETLLLNENVEVVRNDVGGSFEQGVIQYAFSYYYLHGQETNIWYTTPLNYISYFNRGASEGEKVPCSFTINISNLDTRFDYIRIYSIQRTSEANAIVRIVKDLALKDDAGNNKETVSFVDDGTIGESFDYNALFYIGGESIVANTITMKDSTLFLGNFSLNRQQPVRIDFTDLSLTTVPKIYTSDKSEDPQYSYTQTMQTIPPYFKPGERYAFGVQFQHKTGKWSDPILVKTDTVRFSEGVSYNPDSGVYRVPNLQLTIPSSKITNSLDDYVKVRGVCIFPNISQRQILTQGVLCPTVFNFSFRSKNAPFAQPSWCFRPRINNTSFVSAGNRSVTGNLVEFRHNHILPKDSLFNSEVQGALGYYKENIDSSLNADNSDVMSEKEFGVDESIVTLNSPEIDNDDSFFNFPLSTSNLKLKITGVTMIEGTRSIVDISTQTPSMTGSSFDTFKLVRTDGKSTVADVIWKDYSFDPETYEKSENQYKYLIYPWHRTGSLSNDTIRPADKGQTTSLLKSKKTLYYRFSRKNVNIPAPNNLIYDLTDVGIHNYINEELLKLDSFEYQNKISYIGNIDTVLNGESYILGAYDTYRYINAPIFNEGLTSVLSTNPEDKNKFKKQTTPVRIGYKSNNHIVLALDNAVLPAFETNEDTSVTQNWGGTIIEDVHQWNGTKIDFYSPPPDAYTEEVEINDRGDFDSPIYPFEEKKGLYLNPSNMKLYYVSYYQEYITEQTNAPDEPGAGRWRYIGIKYTLNIELVALIPETYYYYIDETNSSYHLYIVTSNKILEEVPSNNPDSSTTRSITRQLFSLDQDWENGITLPYLFIGELINENPLDIDTENSLWFPAGEPVAINRQGNTIVKYTHGDTWYQRYDCLKTLPYTEEYENSIIDVFSFLCETRVNIDGRYDKNRNTMSTAIDFATKFNQINKTYSLPNSLFKYRILPDYFYNNHIFSNQLTWTLEKFAGSEIDSWTNITLANTLDFDGTKGEIKALCTFNDNVLCFQDNAISSVLFNSRVQIPTTDGVPIEISNSGKMDGSRVISDSIGCSNKWSICTTPNALYFMDSNSKKLYAFSDKLQTISDTHGFDHHFKSIEHFDSEKTFYDPIRQDVYLVWDNQCLVWSELLGQFTSFMSYEGVPAMFNIGDKFYCLFYSQYWDSEQQQYVAQESYTHLYSMFEGSYNRFFHIIKPVKLAFISNPDGSTDKIFSTLGARLDIFREPILENGNWDNDEIDNPDEKRLFHPSKLQHKRFFDYIQVSNEYQDTGLTYLPQSWVKPANHGFNRDYNVKKKFRQWRVDIPRDSNNKLDRIRNMWAKIELGFIPPTTPMLTVAELLKWAEDNNITDFSITKYYEGLLSGDSTLVADSGLAEATSDRIIPAPTPGTEDLKKAYKKMHMVLHDVDVQYFV